MRCANCGHEPRDATRFCGRCGRELVLVGAHRPEIANTPSPTRRVRKLLPYVLTVALALGTNWYFSHRQTSSSASRDAAAAQSGDTEAALGPDGALDDPMAAVDGVSAAEPMTARAYAAGRCLTWDEERGSQGRATRDVACDQPHLLQLSGNINLTTRFADYPSAQQWDTVFSEDCRPSVEALLGQPLDPFGKFSIYGIFPTRDAWARGERTVWCGVTGRDASFALKAVPLTEDARGAAQALVAPVGTCLGAQGQTTPCTGPHVREVTGLVDLDGSVASLPDAGDGRAWQTLAAGPCEAAARVYLGRALNGTDLVGWEPIDRRSWVTGRRTLECLIGTTEAGKLVEVHETLRAG